MADGNYSLTFKIYTVSTGGIAAWSETQSTVAVTSGAFSVNIGSTDLNGVNVDLNTPPYYLGITIGTNAEMTPRIQLGMAPFSMNTWSVPSGQVAFFNLSACPTGWTDQTSSWGGRYLVAKTTSATLAGTVGTALTDGASMENRAVGQHNHTLTDPGHSHSTQIWGASYNGSGPNYSPTSTMYNPYYTGSTSNTTGITINNAGSVAGTNAPYVQLLVCQKN